MLPSSAALGLEREVAGLEPEDTRILLLVLLDDVFVENPGLTAGRALIVVELHQQDFGILRRHRFGYAWLAIEPGMQFDELLRRERFDWHCVGRGRRRLADRALVREERN